MAHFSDDRVRNDETGEDSSTDVENAMRELVGEMDALRKDDIFHSYLNDPLVRKAVAHWTGARRETNQQFLESLNDNPQVRAVFGKFIHLQQLSKRAKVPFPIREMMKRSPLVPRRKKESVENHASRPAAQKKEKNAVKERSGFWARHFFFACVQVCVYVHRPTAQMSRARAL